jgi:hypothetical protein
VSEQDILDMISTLDANKAVGPDIISNNMMIAAYVQISKPLCMLFNKSLHQNIFPTPNFKRGRCLLLSLRSEIEQKCLFNISDFSKQS